MTVTLTFDEQRIVNAIRSWAAAYERRHEQRGPWSLDGVRARALIKVAEAIEQGRHRL